MLHYSADTLFYKFVPFFSHSYAQCRTYSSIHSSCSRHNSGAADHAFLLSPRLRFCRRILLKCAYRDLERKKGPPPPSRPPLSRFYRLSGKGRVKAGIDFERAAGQKEVKFLVLVAAKIDLNLLQEAVVSFTIDYNLRFLMVTLSLA